MQLQQKTLWLTCNAQSRCRRFVVKRFFNVMIRPFVNALGCRCICSGSLFPPASRSLDRKRHLSVLGFSLMCTSTAVSLNKWDSSEKPSKTNKSNKVLSLTLCPSVTSSPLFSHAFTLFIWFHTPQWSLAIVYLFSWSDVSQFNEKKKVPRCHLTSSGSLKKSLTT